MIFDDTHPLIPPGFEGWPAPYGDLAEIRRFLLDPSTASSAMLAKLGQGCEATIARAIGVAPRINPLTVIGFPSTPKKLAALLRDAWLIDAHRELGGGAQTLLDAVRAFAVHPWPNWEHARICPPLHPKDHRPYYRPLFYAFQAGGGKMPDSYERFRQLLLNIPTNQGQNFVLGECWQPTASISSRG